MEKQLLSNAPELFALGKKRQANAEEDFMAPPYEEIGRLKEDVTNHDEVEVERLVRTGLKILFLTEGNLVQLIKSAPAKYAIA